MALSDIMTRSLISANASRQMARTQQSAKKQMDGQAGVLDAEIKLDGARGGDTKKKEEELEKTKKKASALEETTINTLTAANDDLKKAAKADLEVERAEKAAEKKKAEKAAEKKKAEKKAEEEKAEKTAKTSSSETDEVSDENKLLLTGEGPANKATINVLSDGVSVSSGKVAKPTGNNLDVLV